MELDQAVVKRVIKHTTKMLNSHREEVGKCVTQEEFFELIASAFVFVELIKQNILEDSPEDASDNIEYFKEIEKAATLICGQMSTKINSIN